MRDLHPSTVPPQVCALQLRAVGRTSGVVCASCERRRAVCTRRQVSIPRIMKRLALWCSSLVRTLVRPSGRATDKERGRVWSAACGPCVGVSSGFWAFGRAAVGLAQGGALLVVFLGGNQQRAVRRLGGGIGVRPVAGVGQHRASVASSPTTASTIDCVWLSIGCSCCKSLAWVVSSAATMIWSASPPLAVVP